MGQRLDPGAGDDPTTSRAVEAAVAAAGPVTLRLLDAMNRHDLDSFVRCFATDYESSQPAHPDRAFRGADQVRTNWSGVFDGVPDFHAELLSAAPAPPDLELSEWRWSGTHRDGEPFEMCGAMVLRIGDDRIVSARLYMEPVTRDGVAIDEMVQETYRPPAS